MKAKAIAGTVRDAEIRWSRKGKTLFDRIVIEEADGHKHAIRKAVALDEIAAFATPGASGTFYICDTFDLRGLHGVKLLDGRRAAAFPLGANIIVGAVCMVVTLSWIVFQLLFAGKLPLIALAGFIFGCAAFLLTRTAKTAVTRLFDAGERAAAAAPATIT
jgi:hypothetical protein